MFQSNLLKLSGLLFSSSLALASLSSAAQAENAPWTGFDTKQGSASFETSANKTNITSHQNRYYGVSSNLDIPEHYHVNIDQISKSSLFAAKAAADADPTKILGKLTSNGRLLVIDQNGFFFGQNSIVDASGFMAVAGEISEHQIMNNRFGDYNISNTNGSIILEGQINIEDAGLAAFVAPHIVNRGIIQAKLSKVAFAAGEEVTLDLYGDNLIEIAVDGGHADALIEQAGTINAEGGEVVMTAQTAKDIVDNVVNMSGVTRVASATQEGGKIVLSGGTKGTVEVSGEIDASGESGGSIDITGEDINITQTAFLSADGGQNGDGGDIILFADNNAIYRGDFSAKGGVNAGNGGFIETSAKHDVEFGNDVVIDVSATHGDGGLWLLDPTDLTVTNGLAATIVGTLTGGGDVSLDTFAVGPDQGHIYIDNNITWNGSGSLTLAASADIHLNARITSDYALGDGTDGAVTLNAGRDVLSGSYSNVGPNNNRRIKTQNGNVNLIAGQDVKLGGSNTKKVDITAGSGDITVDAGRDLFVTSDADNFTGNRAQLVSASGDIDIDANRHVRIISGSNTDASSRVQATAGSITIDARSLTVKGSSNSSGELKSNVATTIKTIGNVRLRNGSVVQTDALDIDARKIVQNLNNTEVTVNTLTGKTKREAEFQGDSNDVTTILDFETGSAAAHDGGFLFADSANNGFNVTGIITTDGGKIDLKANTNSFNQDLKISGAGALQSNDGNIDIENTNGRIIFHGDVNAGTGDVLAASASSLQLWNGSYVNADTFTTNVLQVQQYEGSKIDVATLNGTVQKYANFTSSLNEIRGIDSFEVGVANWYTGPGGFDLYSSGSFLAINGTLASNGLDINIENAGASWSEKLQVFGTVDSDGGNVNLTNNKGHIAVENDGTIDAAAGDVTLFNDNALIFANNSTVTAETLDLTGHQVRQNAGSTINANTMTGSLKKYAHLDGTANQIGALGDFAVGTAGWYNDANGLRVVDNGGLDITGAVSSTGGAIDIFSDGSGWSQSTKLSGQITSAGGDVALRNTDGNIVVTNAGDIDAGTGNVDFSGTKSSIQLQGVSTVTGATLNFEGSRAQQFASSFIDADAITGSVLTTAEFAGTNNAIDSVGDFATGTAGWNVGGFTIQDDNGFNVSGTVSTTGGDIAVTTNANSFDDQVIVDAAGSIVSAGGNINIDNNGSGGGFITVYGDIDAATGDIDLNGRQMKLNGTSTITANTLNTTGSIVNQQSGSTITANTLTGSLAAWADFSGVNNAINELSDFATGTAGWSDGGFKLVDTGGINATGNVSSTGGDIDIFTNGTIWSEALSISGQITSGGGDIDLANASGAVVLTNSGDVDAGSGDLGFVTSGSVQLQGVSSATANAVDFQSGQVRQGANSTLTATTVTGSVTQYAHLDGTANQIGALGDFAVGTAGWYNDANGFRLVNADTLDVAGDLTTSGANVDFDIDGNLNMLVNGSVDAFGGNIDLVQTGTFSTAAIDTLRTSGTGTIDLIQNAGGLIQDAVDAIENTGSGLNTIVVSAGDFFESVDILEDNFLLKGNNFGINGNSNARLTETVIDPNSPGFYVSGNNIIIDGFTLTNGSSGIEIDGSNNITIQNNIISNNSDNGIYAYNAASDITITRNQISENGTGILLDDANAIEITINQILDNDLYGLRTIGTASGDINVDDNIFTDNAVGARFEDGNIDLSGTPNVFTGGDTALEFSGTSVSVVDNTLGTTSFEGQAQNYVALENGALYDPGTPTEIDALNVTFVGTPFGDLVPFDLDAELTQAQYDYLDDRIIDFNDDGSLGLIFAGNPPPAIVNVDQELILTEFGSPEFNNNGGSLNIQGLPASDITQLLANLAPAAGEGTGSEPTAEELAGIETAAGGDETAGCWSGVLGQLGTVDNINFNLNGDMSETFSNESDC